MSDIWAAIFLAVLAVASICAYFDIPHKLIQKRVRRRAAANERDRLVARIAELEQALGDAAAMIEQHVWWVDCDGWYVCFECGARCDDRTTKAHAANCKAHDLLRRIEEATGE